MADKLSLKVMPHSSETERCVLGCMLIDSETINIVKEVLSEDDFYDEEHKWVYKAIVSLADRGKAVDTLTLSNELKENNVFDKIGGYEFLIKIGDSVLSTNHVDDYCTIIKEKSIRRRLIRELGSVIDQCYGDSIESFDIIEAAQRAVYNISMDNSTTDFTSLSSAVSDAVNELNRIQKLDEKVIGVPSGFAAIDDITSGFQKGDMVLIAARPSMGKTALAVNIAQNAAIRYKKSVAIFSLEMPTRQLANRIMSGEAEVDSSRLRIANIFPSEWSSLYDTVREIREKKVKLFINDTSGISVGELRRKCRKLKATEGLDLIIIDYLQLMTINERSESRQQEISTISRTLKSIAKELDCPIIALSQLSRGPEARTNKRPMLSDLRESGAIEQDADLVMLLYRDKYYNPESEDDSTEVIIAKHRNGSVGTVKLKFRGEYTKFITIEDDPTSSEAYSDENLG
ncbi:replicative DNA helicase [Anaerofustis butyriciformans]|uniref:replicative DNA helicase n=1 Tax=Anaerofustis TaxID=264995 RepID=UPI003F88C6C7